MTITHPCQICESSTMKFYRIFHGVQYNICAMCGVVAMDKLLSASELAQQYDTDYFERDYKKNDEFSYFSDQEEAVASCGSRVRVVREYTSIANKYVLDVGCAAGYFLEALKRAESNVVVEGVEVSFAAVKIAKEVFDIPIVANDLLAISGTDKYDIITMFQTLEHLSDPVAYLKKCKDLLREGGLLFVEVPNMRTIDRLFDGHILERIFSVPYHTFMFTPSSLKVALRKSGFRVIKERVYMSAIVGGLITSSLSLFSRKAQKKSPVSANTSILLPTVPYSFIRAMLARIFPGSNMLMIAQKEKTDA